MCTYKFGFVVVVGLGFVCVWFGLVGLVCGFLVCWFFGGVGWLVCYCCFGGCLFGFSVVCFVCLFGALLWLVGFGFLFLRLHGSTEREEGLNNVNDQQLGTHFFL